MTDRDGNEDGRAAGQGQGSRAGPGHAQPDLDSLARDWITLWQSEIAALAHDREAAETVARLAAIWAGLAASWLRAAPPAYPAPAHEPPAARPAAAPGPAAPASAPDAGMAQIGVLLGELAERLDGIERRLASLERGSSAGRAGAGNRGRPGGAGGTAKRRAKPAR